jgi:hypothetical protein
MPGTCLHCVLQRALAAEEDALRAQGLTVTVREVDRVSLPVPGSRVYRQLRALLRDVRTHAAAGPLRITMLGIVPARSHVDVVMTFRRKRGWGTVSCAVPRFVEDALWAGCAGHAFDAI